MSLILKIQSNIQKLFSNSKKKYNKKTLKKQLIPQLVFLHKYFLVILIKKVVFNHLRYATMC